MADEIDGGSRMAGPGAESPESTVKTRMGALRIPWSGPMIPSAMTPDSLVKMFWQSRWILLLCIVGSLGAGLAYIAQSTPVFTSVSKLYVQQKMVSPPGVDTRSMPRYNLYTQAELLKSTSVLSVAVEDPNLGRMRTLAETGNPVAYLQRHIQVTVGKNDDVVAVSLDSPYPAEAAEIVNVVVDAYIADHEQHRQRSSGDLLSSLRSKLDDGRMERDKKLQALTQFKKDNTSLALESDQNASMLQRYLRLETAYTDAQIQTMATESYKQRVLALADRPAALQPRAATGAGTPVAAVTERSQLESKLFERTLERVTSQALFTANHQHFETLDRQIQQIKDRIAAIDRETYTAALADAEQRCVEARQTEERIAGLLEDERQEVVANSAQLAEYARLKEEYEQSKEFCQTLEQQIRGANLNDDFEPQEIRVLERAGPQAKPSRPQRARIMGIALVLGILIGGSASLVRDMLDQTIRSADEIQKLLGLPVLGVIPSMPRRQKASWRGQKTRLQPDSKEAEAFRTVRTGIVFGAAKENARTILVTSPSAGDGKSTLVSNLAIAMAQAGQKTVVLDADFRKPTQHILFGSEADRQGLMAALNGKASLSQAIQSTEVQGLSLLSCGSSVPNPAETLSSPVFLQVLRRLAQVYDRVILDAPPVMAVTDARVLGALCDVTVLVLRADRSRRHTCQRAIDALETTGSHLLGAVVNDVGRKGERFGYYGGYGSHYAGARNEGKALQIRRTEPAAVLHQVAASSLSKEGAST
jgi:polysaccharide biosynthesis transport protein